MSSGPEAAHQELKRRWGSLRSGKKAGAIKGLLSGSLLSSLLQTDLWVCRGRGKEIRAKSQCGQVRRWLQDFLHP